jgi:dsRNA-specific ribonuclease
VPVVLADVFESVTGAIFIDSKASLTALQNSFQPSSMTLTVIKKGILDLPIKK